MPTQEAIVSTVLPKEIEKPIPTRTVLTRSPARKSEAPFTDQAETLRSQVVEESTASAESVKLAPHLSALARKEQAYRQREQALKAREKEVEAKLAQADEFNQLKAKLSSKDYSEAEKLGLNYEEYTKYLLEKQAGEDPQAQALKKLEAEIEALKKSKEDSATQEYEETVAEYKKEIGSLVENSQDFPRVKKLGRQDAVLQLILDSWEEDGTELSIEQASKDVEAYLSALAKDLTIDEPKAQVNEGAVKPSLPPPSRTGSKTLNQNMAAVGTAAQQLKPLQYLSESERYAEARRRVLARREGK